MNAGDFRTRRLVLRSTPAADEVQRFADELGWPRISEEPGDPDSGVPHEVVWAVGPAVSLHYLEDPVSRHGYVTVWGDDRKVAEALAALADERLDTWSVDGLLHAVDTGQTPMDVALAVIRLGLGSPDEYDERVFQRIRDAMTHPDTRVREAALYATGYTAWPQYRPLLEHARTADPDPDRCEDAKIMIESFDRTAGGTS